MHILCCAAKASATCPGHTTLFLYLNKVSRKRVNMIKDAGREEKVKEFSKSDFPVLFSRALIGIVIA